MTIEQPQASILENWYKKRKVLVRRKGQSQVGGTLSPDSTLRLLQWTKHDDQEYLLSVHGGDVRDWFHATPGTVASNGTDKLPSSGTAQANAAWVNSALYIGNGLDSNIRFIGGGTTAADFDTTDVLQEPSGGSTGIYTGADFTISGWVRFDSLAGERIVCSIYSNADSGKRPFLVRKENGFNQLSFLCIFDFGVTQGVVVSNTTLVAGRWHHFVCRHDGGTGMAISVDGEAPITNGYTNGVTEPTDVPFVVGGMNGSLTSSLDGGVASLGFWRTANGGGGALSDGDFTTLYNGGVMLQYGQLPAALKGAVLKGWWDLDEDSGDREDSHGAFELEEAGSGVGSAVGPSGSVAVAVAVPEKPTGFTLTFDVTNAGAIPAGTYQYKVAYLGSDGQAGEASDAFTATPASTRRIDISAIPLGPAGQDITGRVLYRLDPGATVYRETTRILDNTTTFYSDNNTTLGASLGTSTLVFNTRVPPCRYMVEHQNRMVWAGCFTSEGDRQTVYISNVNEPWASPILPDLEDPNQGTRATLQGLAAGEITGLRSHGGVVAVFTGGAGHLLLGVEPNDFRIQKFSDHGCVAHRTIQSVRSLLVWLGPDAVYAWDGGQVARISDDQRATIEAMTAAEMAAAHAFVWEDRYYLCWPTGCIYWDLEYKTWGTLTNNLWDDATVTTFVSGSRQRIYAARYNRAQVYQLETGATDAIPASGTAITARWASRDWDMGLGSRDKRVHHVETKYKKSTGSATVTLKSGTGRTIETFTQDMSRVEHQDETVSRHLPRVGEQARNEHFRLEVSTSSTAAEVSLLGAGLHWKIAG